MKQRELNFILSFFKNFLSHFRLRSLYFLPVLLLKSTSYFCCKYILYISCTELFSPRRLRNYRHSFVQNLTVLEKNGGCVNENISGSDIDVLNVSYWLSTTDILILDKKSESMYNNISQSIIKKVSKANSVESEKYPELKGEAWSVNFVNLSYSLKWEFVDLKGAISFTVSRLFHWNGKIYYARGHRC